MIYLSEYAEDELKNVFPECRIVKAHGRTYPPVDSHPDMFMCAFYDGSVIHADFTEIGHRYPKNASYNAVCLERYFIHNLKYTSQKLLDEAGRRNLTFINVRQGYTKCSCVVVDGHSIITSDNGIFKTLSQYDDIDVLKITEGNVRLEKFEYGFLGGASGKVGDMLVFSGDIKRHPDYEKIADFVNKHNVKIKSFDFPLHDIGSIIDEK